MGNSLLPFRFLATLLGCVALLLSSCCANNVCDRDDSQEDAIKLVFRNGFSVADLDTVQLQRYPLTLTPANAASTKPETVTLIRSAAQSTDTIVLNTSTPFTQAGSGKIDQYKYVVRYSTGRRSIRPETALVIDAITLKGGFEGDGCCTYYKNTERNAVYRRDSMKIKSVLTSQDAPIIFIDK